MAIKRNAYSLIERAQHVFPRSGGDWSVRKTGAEKASRNFSTQKEAIDYATTVAKKNASGVFVHRRDGRIASHDSYKRGAESSRK